jgi:alkanesulfonate monooxygenase SsuD/methylene tetrahydromethanopterin reductase-like flavin-dependent oxidoreductase (luciferase family)
MVGTPDDVRRQLGDFLARTSADEIIITGQIFDHAARVRSYELLAEVRAAMAGEQPTPQAV